MKSKGQYLKAKYEDKIVFTAEKEPASQLEVTKVWRKSR